MLCTLVPRERGGGNRQHIQKDVSHRKCITKYTFFMSKWCEWHEKMVLTIHLPWLLSTRRCLVTTLFCGVVGCFKCVLIQKGVGGVIALQFLQYQKTFVRALDHKRIVRRISDSIAKQTYPRCWTFVTYGRHTYIQHFKLLINVYYTRINVLSC